MTTFGATSGNKVDGNRNECTASISSISASIDFKLTSPVVAFTAGSVVAGCRGGGGVAGDAPAGLGSGQHAPRQYRSVNPNTSIFLQFDNPDASKATALRYVGIAVKGQFSSQA